MGVGEMALTRIKIHIWKLCGKGVSFCTREDVQYTKQNFGCQATDQQNFGCQATDQQTYLQDRMGIYVFK